MKILLYGSTPLTAAVEAALMPYVVGHIPSNKPSFKGKMQSKVVPEETECDLRLSIQYDQKIYRLHEAYNLHTGLLPAYGGCDILYHTLKNKEKEQGLTFHRITERFDEGVIIAKAIYPVLEDDTVADLYMRMLRLAPHFVLAAIDLIPLTRGEVTYRRPALYKRGEDMTDEYIRGYTQIYDVLQSNSLLG